MRIALAPSEVIGLRAGRVLLADERVAALGAYDTNVHSGDSRVETIDDLDGWDLLVSDAAFDDPRIQEAIRRRVPIVTPHALRDISASAGTTPLVAAASVESGLPAAIAALLMQRFDTIETVVAAFTVATKRGRRDRSVMFPDPVGARWSETIPSPVTAPEGVLFARAPYDGRLGAISVRVDGFTGTHHETALDGVVDDLLFLGAIALAGAAIMLLDGPSIARQIEVQTEATAYLDACTGAGLGIASFRAAS